VSNELGQINKEYFASHYATLSKPKREMVEDDDFVKRIRLLIQALALL
jgi:hypothetical protein